MDGGGSMARKAFPVLLHSDGGETARKAATTTNAVESHHYLQVVVLKLGKEAWLPQACREVYNLAATYQLMDQSHREGSVRCD